MNLLTWHGTILRVAADGRWVQATLLPERAGTLSDLSIELPPFGVREALSSPVLPDVTLLPGRRRGTVHFRRGADFLCMQPDADAPAFNRTAAGEWETFLVVDEGRTAALRTLLGHAWIAQDEARIGRGATRLDAGFALEIGTRRFDFAEVTLDASPDGERIVVTARDETRVLVRDASAPAASAIVLRRVAHHHMLDVGTAEEFAAGSDRRLSLPAGTDIITQPLFVSEAHRNWSFDHFWRPEQTMPLGRVSGGCRICRTRDAGVVLARFGEGALFNDAGTLNEDGFLMHMQHPLPPGLTRDGATSFLLPEVLRDAPVLPGTHIVFINGNLQNYYHWLAESLLALDVMRQYAPAGAKLLIPGTIAGFRERPINRFDHLAVLRAAGLDGFALAEAPQGLPLARLEEAIWLDDYIIERIPGVHLRDFRDRLLAGHDPSRPRRRICIRRRHNRAVANRAPVEAFLSKQDFTFHELENMPPAEQRMLFQDAEFVVAPHGAGLANLLYCRPGTRVLEISPDAEFRPFFWLMSEKLGFSHGVLPCPTDDGSFIGKMIVDMNQFRALFRMLSCRI
jgi:hypothetical protein